MDTKAKYWANRRKFGRIFKIYMKLKPQVFPNRTARALEALAKLAEELARLDREAAKLRRKFGTGGDI